VLATGHVQCWGDNEQGQLGDGNTTASDTSVEVHGISDATQITAGFLYTCAVLATGHIECWGYNESGQLGDGNTTNTDTPVEVLGIP
jgi:alpha-tubulin suppressor-like RCC1 family protein